MLRSLPLVCDILRIYQLALFAWVILSWIRVPSDHPIGRIHRALDTIIMPVVLPLRRVIPPLPLGGISLDLSVILIFILISVLC